MYEFQIPQEHHIDMRVDPNLLFALAIGMVGDAAAAIAIGAEADPRRLTPPEALRFAATYFDAYINARLDADIAPEFGVLASAAYYMSENPGNARVILNATSVPDVPHQSPLYSLVYSLLKGQTPLIAGEMYEDMPSVLLQSLEQFYLLEVSANVVLQRAAMLRHRAYDYGADRDVLYADIAMALCRQKIAAAARTVLPDTSGLRLQDWEPALRRGGFPRELWPAQRKIANAGLFAGRPGIIQMPTSAGKTRATELIIRSAFLSGRTRLAVIVAPFRALCHDIRGDLARAFEGERIVLDEASDAYQIDFLFDLATLPKTVLIVTPEKLLYILRRTPELAREIGLIIYDEGHLFDSDSRGVTYELLLTSLKLMIRPTAQVILISAVIENAAAVASWLVGDETRVVDGKGLLPTARSIAFASWKRALGQLRYVVPASPEVEEFFVPRVIERVGLTRKNGKGAGTYPSEKGTDVGLYLGLRLFSNGPIAVFCGNKASVAKLCRTAVKNYKLAYPSPTPSTLSNERELALLVRHLEFHLGSSSALVGAARLGIFGHHGSIPQGIRLCIEHAMKEQHIRFVICTSTLAQGVNLPIKYLIVTSVQQGADRIMVRDFHNLIGRAGRSGMHTEGSVIFASPDIYDGRDDWRQRWRWRSALELLNQANSEPCNSNILYVFHPFHIAKEYDDIRFSIDELVRLAFEEESVTNDIIDQKLAEQPDEVLKAFQRDIRDRARVIQSVASYLLSHIDFEVEDWTEQLVALVNNTLAYHVASEGQRHELTILFELLADVLRDKAREEEVRVLLRRSPLAAQATLRVKAWIENNIALLERAVEEGDLFRVVFEYVRNQSLPPMFANVSDIEMMQTVGEMWLDERTYEQIHDELAAIDFRVGRGARPRKVTIENVVAYCESGFGYEIAMVVAAMADAAEHVDDSVFAALNSLHKRLKYGLDSVSAIAFHEAGFADRRIAAILGGIYPNVIDRAQARGAITANRQIVEQVLSDKPAYFREVFREIVGN